MVAKNVEIIVSPAEPKVILRSADEGDLCNLRQWKNEHRNFFFYKEEISPKQQSEWFCAYQKRPQDFMFIVNVDDNAIGCMGIRCIDEMWDVYNVILGLKNYGGRGIMSKALQAMFCFALSERQSPIMLRVLKTNPAIAWYQKNGFAVNSEQSEYFCMTYKKDEIL